MKRLALVLVPVVLAAAASAADARTRRASSDRIPPRATLTRPANPALVVLPAPPGGRMSSSETILGTATDRGSGVSGVTLTFRACSLSDYRPQATTACTGAVRGPNSMGCPSQCTVRPALQCGAGRTTCTFSALPPSASPGVWLVGGTVADRAGNSGRIPPIQILVV